MLRHLRGAAVGLVAAVTLLGLSWGAPAVLDDATAALAPGGSLDAMLGALALVVSWAIAAWLTLGVLLTTVAALPGSLGRLTNGLAARVTPTSVRNAVALTIGISALVPAAAAGAATAPDPAYPVLDRVVVQPAPAAASEVLTPDVALAPSDVSAADPTDAGPPIAPATGLVEVRPGDSLWRIAASALGPDASPREIAEEWPRWYAANQSVIGADPGLIHPGQELRAPSEGAAKAAS